MLTVNYQTDETIVKAVLEREFTDAKIKALLDRYLGLFESEYINVTHKQYVELFMAGLLSSLERKSIEPIALSLKGPGAVRGFQAFFSNSTFNTGDFLKQYQSLVENCLGVSGKEKTVRRVYFSPMRTRKDMHCMTVSCISRRSGTLLSMKADTPGRKSPETSHLRPRTKSQSNCWTEHSPPMPLEQNGWGAMLLLEATMDFWKACRTRYTILPASEKTKRFSVPCRR